MGRRPCLMVASNALKFTEKKRPKCPDPGLQIKLLHQSTKVPVAKARKKRPLAAQC